MTEKQQQEHAAFRDWLYSLSIIDYNKTCYRIQKECHVTKRAFDYWRAGKQQPSWHCRRIINDIAGKQIYDLND